MLEYSFTPEQVKRMANEAALRGTLFIFIFAAILLVAAIVLAVLGANVFGLLIVAAVELVCGVIFFFRIRRMILAATEKSSGGIPMQITREENGFRLTDPNTESTGLLPDDSIRSIRPYTSYILIRGKNGVGYYFPKTEATAAFFSPYYRKK